MLLMALGLITFERKASKSNLLGPRRTLSKSDVVLDQLSQLRRFSSRNALARCPPSFPSAFWKSVTLFLIFPSNSIKMYPRYSNLSVDLTALSFHSLIISMSALFAPYSQLLTLELFSAACCTSPLLQQPCL